MRIQPATSRALTRTGLALSISVAVLGAGACARNQIMQPESRLGGVSPAQDTYRWNGNAKRQSYDSKGLGAPGRADEPGSTAAGDTVLFTSDSTDLTPEAKSILDGYAAQLRGKPIRAISIVGHADERQFECPAKQKFHSKSPLKNAAEDSCAGPANTKG